MKPTVYEKAKLLDGMSQQEWNELKRLIDEAFEQKKRELSLDVKLSADTLSRISESHIF